MAKFENSHWAESEFSKSYRDDADVFVPFRHQFIKIIKSLYSFSIGADAKASVLDLGCGDGTFIQQFLLSFSPAGVTLVDGSPEMLAAAKERLKEYRNINYVNAAFQELYTKESLNRNFDFIFSSLAIHHLPYGEKKQLYNYVYKILSPNGCFVNFDVVIPSSMDIEKYYLHLWSQWIEDHPAKDRAETLMHMPKQYKENTDNVPDTLELQLETLKDIGFKEVDCIFKYGIFTLFGGKKSSSQ